MMLPDFMSRLFCCGMRALHFSVLGDPVAQARPRFGKGKHVYEPAKCTQYKKAIRDAAVEAMKKQGFTRAHREMPVRLECKIFKSIPTSKQKWWKLAAKWGLIAPVSRSGDADNILKACSDALNAVAFDDDSQVCEIAVFVRYSDVPRTEIAVKAMYVNVGDLKEKVKMLEAENYYDL